LPIDLQPLEAQGVFGHGLAQLRYPHHRRILVVSIHEVIGRRSTNDLGSFVVWEALSQIDRLMLAGQRRHHFEDRRAETRHHRIRVLHAFSLIDQKMCRKLPYFSQLGQFDGTILLGCNCRLGTVFGMISASKLETGCWYSTGVCVWGAPSQ